MAKTDEKPKAPAPAHRTKQALAICVLATIALTALDLWTKDLALEHLSTTPLGEPTPVCEASEDGYMYPQRLATEPYEVIAGNLELRYAENCGAAFSMLRDASSFVRHAVFGTAATVASIALFWMFWVGRGGRAFAWAVPLIVSGALGNLADRVRLGYVVDFIRFYWEESLPLLGRQWPTFNVADITISIGVGLLLIDGYLEGKKEKEAEKKAEEKAKADPNAATAF